MNRRCFSCLNTAAVRMYDSLDSNAELSGDPTPADMLRPVRPWSTVCVLTAADMVFQTPASKLWNT
jgi:hypothetical protein